MSEEIGKIYSTNDYSKFKSVKGNRMVNKLHVKNLVESMEERNLLAPIAVNEFDEIIDGQHRFEARKQLKLPIEYYYVIGYSVKEIKIYNMNMKNWIKKDYLDAFCDLEYPDYLEFRKLMDLFPEFGITIIEKMFMHGFENKDYKPKMFEKGEFKIYDYQSAKEIAEKVKMFSPYYDGYIKRTFVYAVLAALNHKRYDHQKMIERVKINPLQIHDCFSKAQYKDMIEKIYNRNLSHKNHIVLRG